jgi:hypothetical protein
LLALIDISPLLIKRGSILFLNLSIMGLPSRPIRPDPLVP